MFFKSSILLLLTALEVFPQTFWSVKPSFIRHSDGIPSCNSTPTQYITESYAVTGYNGSFHTNESCSNWTVYNVDPARYDTNATTLWYRQFEAGDDGLCIICNSSFSFYLFEVTVQDIVSLRLEEVESDHSYPVLLKEAIITFNGSVNFTFSCHFTGYPPVQSITWDLGYFNDYDCVTYSEDNQTVTIGLSSLLTAPKYTSPSSMICTGRNGIQSFSGIRGVGFTFGYRDNLKFYQPLLSQTSGKIEINSTGKVTFNCSTARFTDFGEHFRVCLVVNTKAEKCLNRQHNYRCCSCEYYNRSCPWLLHTRTDVNSMCQVTTSLPGNYQCQVYDPVFKIYQPLGDPIQVIRLDEVTTTTFNLSTFTEANTSIPVEVITTVVVVTVIVLCLVLLAVLIAIILLKNRIQQKYKTMRCATTNPLNNKEYFQGKDTAHAREVTMEILIRFIPSICHRWYLIACGLDMEQEATVIRASQSGCNAATLCSKVLIQWIDQGKNVTWEKLLTVLSKQGLKRVAKVIKAYLYERSLIIDVKSVSNKTHDGVPTVVDLADFVPRMAPYWFIIACGLSMGTEAMALEASQGDGDARTMCSKMLGEWIKKDPSATWSKLLDVLHVLKLNELAKDVKASIHTDVV